MSRFAHRVFIGILVAIVFITLIALFYKGMSYYGLNLEERVYHTDHRLLKPSGVLGHGLGIVGTVLTCLAMLAIFFLMILGISLGTSGALSEMIKT